MYADLKMSSSQFFKNYNKIYSYFEVTDRRSDMKLQDCLARSSCHAKVLHVSVNGTQTD